MQSLKINICKVKSLFGRLRVEQGFLSVSCTEKRCLRPVESHWKPGREHQFQMTEDICVVKIMALSLNSVKKTKKFSQKRGKKEFVQYTY